jgi:hypothetical protein
MKGKPSIDAFIGGAVQDGAAPAGQVEVAASSPKFTKTIRLSRSAERLLKEAAHNQSMESGHRVTESDLIEQAIFKYLNK